MEDPKQQSDEPEQAIVALTVAWMLTCMSTAVALLVVLVLTLLMITFPAAADALSGIAAVFFFLSMVTGVLCLAFTFLVLRTRQMTPPRAIKFAAVLIGLAPFVCIAITSIVAFLTRDKH